MLKILHLRFQLSSYGSQICLGCQLCVLWMCWRTIPRAISKGIIRHGIVQCVGFNGIMDDEKCSYTLGIGLTVIACCTIIGIEFMGQTRPDI